MRSDMICFIFTDRDAIYVKVSFSQVFEITKSNVADNNFRTFSVIVKLIFIMFLMALTIS